MSRLRTGAAAAYLGVHPETLRTWANDGQIPCIRLGDERRFDTNDLDIFAGRVPEPKPRREALYVRVSGTSGQETSLVAQEEALRVSATGEVVAVFKDKGSALNENRAGLKRLLKGAQAGEFTVVRVTHEDRLARFGVSWLTALLTQWDVSVEALHSKGSAGGMEELLADFMSLVSTFAGRMYGIRGGQARKRLLASAVAKTKETKEVQ